MQAREAKFALRSEGYLVAMHKESRMMEKSNGCLQCRCWSHQPVSPQRAHRSIQPMRASQVLAAHTRRMAYEQSGGDMKEIGPLFVEADKNLAPRRSRR